MNKLIQYGLTVVIGVVLFASLLVPCVNTATTQIKTVTIENDGAGWLKLGYNAGEDYDFNIAVDGNVTVGGQSGALGDMVYYADPNRAIFSNANGFYLIEGGEAPSVHAFEDDISVTRTEEAIIIKDGTTNVINTTAPAWAYVPDSAGVYGFFTDGGLNLDDKPKVAVGNYAEIYAYNDYLVTPFNYELNLEEQGDYGRDNVIWGNEPAVMNAGNNNLLGAATTWTEGIYTCNSTLYGAGYCGIHYIDVSNVTNEIVIPATISHDGATYVVKAVGYTSGTTPIIDNSLLTQNVTINLTNINSTNKISIGAHAFEGCTHITSVSDWTKLTAVGDYAFSNSGISGHLSFRNNASLTLGAYAFANCDSILSVTKAGTGTITAGAHCFEGCSSIQSTSLISGSYAFANCENLKTAYVNTLSPEHIFDGCVSLEKITYKSATFTTIGAGLAKGCVNLKSLYLINTTPTAFLIPAAVTNIGANAFEGCSSIDNILILPENITTVGGNAFKGCDSIPNLIVCGSATFGEDSLNMAGVKEVLDLGNNELTTTSYGLNAEEARADVPALGYIAPISIQKTVVVNNDSPAVQMLAILPLIVIGGLIAGVVGSVVVRRYS